MRNLDRNKVNLYYCVYAGKTAAIDSNGNDTGEYVVTYNTPVKISASVASAGGEASTKIFGTELNYDKTITIARQFASDIDENTVFIIDSSVVLYDSSGSIAYDYKVTRIVKTLNTVVIAVTKVR